MLVLFKTPWFGPTAIVIKDKIQHISGRRYKKGVQEVDDALKDALPKSAKIVSKMPEELPAEAPADLEVFDTLRADGDRFVKMAEDAEKADLKNKQARMAKARASKGARKGAATVE